MKNNKRIIMIFMMILLTVVLVACKKRNVTVTFDSRGGTAVEAAVVRKGRLVTEPTDPTRSAGADETPWSFTGWYKTETGAAANQQSDLFDFTVAVSEDLTLFGGWTQNVVVRFNTKVSQQIPMQDLGASGGTITTAPTVTARPGWRFVGWFNTARGLTWLEETAVQFPLTVSESRTLHAYWEPVDSAAINWTDNETYRSSITKQSRMILNPLTYENSLEDTLISNLATSLYSTEVDWDKAIAQGVADFPGDFSKIKAGDFSIEALDFHYITVGAKSFPLNSEGDELLDENGKYDRDAAGSRTSNEWTFRLREDILFQDGTPVTAHTYEYTLKQYLDKTQNNYRANSYYKTKANPNGVAIANAYEYFSQSTQKLDADGKPVEDANGNHIYEPATVSWDSVGFEVIDEFTFKLKLHEPITQAAAVSFGSFRLVHPEKYQASLNTQTGNTNYGNPNNPYVSYGPYVLKDWDEDQKLVFNKNYDYVAKGTINYKGLTYELVENPEQTLNLYRDKDIDVIGLNATNYNEFSESKNIYRSYTGYPMFLTINTAPSKLESNRNVPPTILFDVRFRQALMYGFDRVDYNKNYDIPNLPSFIPVPGDIKNYVQDTAFFVDSPEYLKVLEDLDVDPDSFGFLPTRALELFDAAYADWLADGNTGAVKLKMIAPDSTIDKLISSRVKAMYESLFEKDGVKRLELDLQNLASEQISATSKNWDFDLTLGGIGFGGSLGSWWQMGAIAFAGGLLGGADLGLSQPYTTDLETGERVYAAYVDQVVEIDLTTTYNRLVALGGLEYLEEEELNNTINLWNWLQEEKDDEGNVTKPAGILRETVYDIATWRFSGSFFPFDGTAAEKFPGGSQDANRIAAAMLKVFYEHVTHIPTGTSASATLYADKVTIEWPAYSTAFGWGAARYRYLNTDTDFQ